MSSPTQEEVFEFRIQPTRRTVDRDDVQRSLESIVREAAEDMARDGTSIDARAEIKGPFAGVGEIVVLLLVALGKGAVGAIGASGGKLFFDRYLKPRLQKQNFVVSEAEPRKPEGGS